MQLTHPRRWLAATAAGLSLALAAGPALADITTVPDADQDALRVTNGTVTAGDWDIDLRSVTIDHGTTEVKVTSTFSFTNADSWNNFSVYFDTNLDGVADYLAMSLKDEGIGGVLRLNPDGSIAEATCTSLVTAEQYGDNGTVTLTLPRTCLGTPATFAARVDVFWFGYDLEGNDLDFVDSAPGQLTDNPKIFSAPVPAASAVVVPSPTPPAPIVTPTPLGPTPACVKAKVALKKAKKAHNSAKIKKARKKVKRAC